MKTNALTLTSNDNSFVKTEVEEALLIEGWRFSFSFVCNSGARASAQAVVFDGSEEGRRQVRCIVFADLYEQMTRQANRCMVKNSDCNYTVSDWESYSYSGPTYFESPGDRVTVVINEAS